MKKYENLGVTAIVTTTKIKIEVPIKGLINGFNLNPENYDGSKVARGKRKEFAEYVANALIDSSNSETGDSFFIEACDRVFEEIMEGYEEFIKYGEEDE